MQTRDAYDGSGGGEDDAAHEVLTAEQVLQQAHAKSFAEVHWLSCRNVRYDNIAVLQHLCNVRVISMVNCGITTLQPFMHCTSLEELYLRKNDIVNLREVTALKGLKALHTLWLKDNACATHEYYYAFALHCCQRLRHLDEVNVTHDLRRVAARQLVPHILDAILACDDAAAAAAAGSSNKNGGGGSNSGSRSTCNKTPQPHDASPRDDGHSNDVVAVASPPRRQRPLQQQQPPSSFAAPFGANTTTTSEHELDASSGAVAGAGAGASSSMMMTSSGGGGGAGNSVGSVDMVAFTTQRTQRAMLMSIVSLLPELTISSLECVQDEVARVLQRRRALLVTSDRTVTSHGAE